MIASRGGKRKGAGRPAGQGKYGEPTKTVRIPLSRVAEIQGVLTQKNATYSLPLYCSKVQAGFPSPAEDAIERYLDLNQQLIKHPAATFIVTATGESMLDAGIRPGDMLIVDRSLEATDGKVVIAALDGELTVKRLSVQPEKIQLMPANPKFRPIDITECSELVIWGVVVHIIHTLS